MIRVQNLVKRFGDFTAVNDVSFDVPKGEIFAFLGPNGAGKTTTIKILTTLLRPTSGDVELDGLDPVKNQHEARTRFGIVFQDPSLDQDLTGWENMDLHGVLYHVPRKIRRERTESLLKRFELWDRRDALVKTFSGGMKRRLEIARGFLHSPKILFPGRADAGARPAKPQPIVEPREATQCHGEHHRLSHYALYGRGRPCRPPDCRDRSWPHRGRGHFSRFERTDQNAVS